MIHPKVIKKQRILFVSFLVLILMTAFVSAGIGYSSLSFDRLIPTILGDGSFKE